MYSIKAASKTTGLTVETLRAWERRYGAVVPRRDDNGRRVYGQQDLARLRLLRRATEAGHPIRRLASLSEHELTTLLEDEGPAPTIRQADLIVQRILEAVAEYKAEDCQQALELAAVAFPPANLVKRILAPALIQVGERWHSGEFSIAQERILSSSVRTLLTSVMNTYQKSARQPAIVFATLSGERHELGIMMCAFLATSRGIRCHYLGSDLPPEEISRVARQTGADCVAVSLIMRSNGFDQQTLLEELCAQLEGHANVWVGGSSLRDVESSDLPSNCMYFESQQVFEDTLDARLSRD